MAHQKFDKFLDEEIGKAGASKIDWDAKRSDWLQRLEEFFSQISSYLDPYVSEGKIKLERGHKEMFEDFIGQYKAPTASISVGLQKIRLVPIGVNVVGARGRIDMQGQNGTVMFVLLEAVVGPAKTTIKQGKKTQRRDQQEEKERLVWKIATRAPKIEFFELNKDSFLDALMEVAHG